MFEDQDSDRIEMDEYTDIQAALPALDVRAGMRRSMGKRDTYLNLLYKFKCRFSDFPSVLHGYFADGDMEDAVILVHSLKGIAASLGAMQLHNAVKELEQQLRRSHSPAGLPRVEHLLEELLQQLEKLDFNTVESNTQSVFEAENATTENQQNWRRGLKELQTPLQKLQVNKVKAQLDQMQQRNWSETQWDELQQLESMVRRYMYKQAAEYIERLL